MLDTTTVNYALDKMADAYKAILPTGGQISEKYVTYVVTSEVLEACAALVLLVVCSVLTYVAVRLISKAKSEGAEIAGVIMAAIGGLGVIVAGLDSICKGKQAALAITNPEMFTVGHLISSIKR
jgi:hypothetical protein